jgi:excinuclease ABC subunit C
MPRTGKEMPTLLRFSDGSSTPDLGPSRYRPAHAKPKRLSIGSRSVVELRDGVRTSAPRLPGVYAMLGHRGQVIYVGKAKNLRARLLSYFRDSSDPKAGKILGHTHTLLWEEISDELAALLRELELIRRYRPRFNVLGQPGRRRYSYLCLGRGPAAYAYTTHEPTGKLLACYGPFVGRRRSQLAVRWLNQYFRLRDCPGTVRMRFADFAPLFEVEPDAAKCLRFELGTCLAPCAGLCSSKTYSGALASAKAFLDGRSRAPIDDLCLRMTQAAEQQRYEHAGLLKARLEQMTWLEDKLTFLRTARSAGSFVYPLEGSNGQALWYILHAGEVQAVVRVPKCAKTADAARTAMKQVFAKPRESSRADDRCGDSVLILSRWFRANAGEKAKLLTPAAAYAMCTVIGERGASAPC